MEIKIVLRLRLVGRHKGIASRLLHASSNVEKGGISESQDTGRSFHPFKFNLGDMV
jgi:hypothetical protein